MKLKHAILAGVAATGLLFSAFTPAYAQNQGMVDETATLEKPEDNWLKVCNDLDDGRKACIMRQVVTNTGVFVGSFLLRDDPTQESRLLAVASMPIGVLLPFGVSWQIDGGKPVRVPYMLCDPQACSAQLVVNEAYIQSLKKGSTLKLTAKNRRNEDIEIAVTLKGFTAVYDNPDALTIQELNAANSTETALEQVLQERANALRNELEPAETPAP